MATMGYFDEQSHDTSDLYFKTLGDFPGFKVTSFEDGYVNVKAFPSSDIEDVLNAFFGCFETCSNFRKELYRVYNRPTSSEFKGIRFTHEGVTIIITPDTTNKDKILAEYWKERYNKRVKMDNYIATGNPYHCPK